MAALERPRRLMIMVKAGEPTDAVIEEFAPLLEPGDMIIDGGNAHFADTRRREKALRERGIHFVGSGVSGGEEGALHGPSIMPGGSAESYAVLGPMLEAISAKVDGEPCCTHIGTDGAGHFVKMVHNGIEYADMQLIAEAYDLLRHVAGYCPAQIAEVFRELEQGPAGLLPDRDHRRDPGAHRRRDRQAVRGHRARRRRAEGHRPLDRADRAGPRLAGDRRSRRRRSPAWPPAGPRCARRTSRWPAAPSTRCARTRRSASSRRSSRRCTRPRSSPTTRAGR